jgi:hypothetical protein
MQRLAAGVVNTNDAAARKGIVAIEKESWILEPKS